MKNRQIAFYLEEYAKLLEANGYSIYKIRAYRRAAATIKKIQENIEVLAHQNQLMTIPGIGKGIASMIEYYLKFEQQPPLKPPTKKITTRKSMLRLFHVFPIVHLLNERFKQFYSIKQFKCCGEFRRKKEVVVHLEYVIGYQDIKVAIDQCKSLQEIESILIEGDNFFSAYLWAGIKLTLYFVPMKDYGISLLHYTGSNAHIEKMIQWSGNIESSVSSFLMNPQWKGRSEKQIYRELDLAYIPPELREGHNEVDAAAKKELSHLIKLEDIRGDLHSHTLETDGTETLEAMVQAAANLGYEYFAITDHSKRLVIAHGMDETRLLKQIEQINRLNEMINGIVILKSIEVDILEDGKLDLSNDVLKELDLVVASIHSKFKHTKEKQTERIIRAMDNPHFNILGHATGRLIYSRPPYEIDMPKILQAAKDRGCFLELNAQPYRLDIHDEYCLLAKSFGVKVAISSDSHSIGNLEYMKAGVFQARRGWLEKKDVINTYPLDELRKLLKRT